MPERTWYNIEERTQKAVGDKNIRADLSDVHNSYPKNNPQEGSEGNRFTMILKNTLSMKSGNIL